MSKIFLGNITSDSDRLLNKYLQKYMPDAIIEPLKAAGIRGKIKNHAKRPDVVLVILDDALYKMCEGVADDVLSLPKVHRYSSDSTFKVFLEEKFGVLEGKVESIAKEVVEVSNEVEDEDFDLTISDAEDTSNDLDKDSIINRLNDELLIRDTIIRNLEAQIEEASDSDDITYFTSKIRSLESELERAREELSQVHNDSLADSGKVAKAEEVLKTVDTLKEELSSERRKTSKLESTVTELRTELTNKDSKLLELQIVIDDKEKSAKDSDELVQQYNELEESLSSMTDEYNSKSDELEAVKIKCFNLEQEVKDLTSKLAELKVVSDKVTELTTRNKSLSDELSETSQLKINIHNLSIDFKRVESERDSLKSKVESLQLQLDSSGDSVKQVEELLSSVDSLKQEISSLEIKVTEKDQVIEELEKSSGVSEELEKANAEIENLSTKVTELEHSLDDKDMELSLVIEDKNNQISLTNALNEEVKQLTKKVEDLEADKAELETSQQKLTNEIDVLRQESVSSKEKLSSSERLEEELTECKKVIAKLEVERNSLQSDLSSAIDTSEKDEEIARLQGDIDSYKARLKESQSELERKSKDSSKEIFELRERCANLEISVAERDGVIKSSENSVFSKMSNIASPKTMFNISIDVGNRLPNMYVFASGSSESNLMTYQTLRRTCSGIGKSVLIIDLVNDSYIDREFGVEKIVSPIEFLQGVKPATEFITRAKVQNVSVISTAFNYLNNLYLLTLDWSRVLTDLSGLADIVILNVGCLNETVSKVLFNAFSGVMQSHIIIKASPINLRTALLTLTGMPSAKSSRISCCNFENSSKTMYQRLAQKFNTQILKDSDVLKL